MLFDLRGRGRRTTVRGVYLGLAILMASGLILFGVGTGVSGGGLFGGLIGNGGGNGSSNQQNTDLTKALKETKQNPSDPAAWRDLVNGWDEQAKHDSPNTSSYTAKSLQDLRQEVAAFQQYLKVTQRPADDVSTLAARAYGALGDYKGEASAWAAVALVDSSDPKPFECYAASAFAAKETRVATLAMNRALSLLPKLQRPVIKTQIQEAAAQPQIAANC